MVLDVIACALIGWGLLRGGLRGFLFQLGQVGILAVAWVAARGLGDLVEGLLAGLFRAEPAIYETLAFFLIFGVVFAAGSAILRAFTKDLHEASDGLSAGDRVLGAVVGGVKGVVFAYVLIVGIIMINQLGAGLAIPYASSVSGRWVMKHNVFEDEEFPRARALARVAYVLHTKGAAELLTNPHFREVVEHPKAGVLRDPLVVDALIRGDWISVMGRDDLWDLLDEPDVQAHLNAIEIQGMDGGPISGAPAPAPPPPPRGILPSPGHAPPLAPSPPSSSHRPPAPQGAP